MKVGVIHRVSDPETAQARGLALYEPHAGVQLLQFCPAKDFSAAIGIWEAGSLGDVRELVDAVLGGASDQIYFAIAIEQAEGLPEAPPASS